MLEAYSPTVSPPAGGWDGNSVVTGFWRLDDNSGWTPPADFQDFLSKGDAPVYLGFGSMPWGAQRNTEIITKAVAMWGGRAIVSKGWGGVKAEDLPPQHLRDRSRAARQLFKHVKAVVHHGGAGTTQTGLEAGKPTFAVPQFFDQPYWAQADLRPRLRPAAGAHQEADATDIGHGARGPDIDALLRAQC